jgi:hypothetical protein
MTQCTYIAWNNTSEWAKNEPIERVHLLFWSHLDVGVYIDIALLFVGGSFASA